MSNRSDFEQQFEKRHYFQSPFGKIEFREVIPSNPKTHIPVLFAPGWRETPELQKECINQVFNTKRRVLTLVHTSKLYKREKLGDYPEAELQKAQTLLSLLKERSIQEVDVITHSEGAINVTIAATLTPERFRNLVLVTPAGLTGKDSLTRVSIGFLKHISQSKSSLHRPNRDVRKIQHKKDVNIIQNMLFALQEGKAIAGFDIHPLLLDLKKKVIRIAVLVGKNDTVFPYAKITSHLNQLSAAPNYGFDIFATKPGGHELYANPAEIMPQIESLLMGLERLSKS